MRQDNFMRAKISIPKKIAAIVLGILFSLIVLEVGLRLGGFIFASFQEQKNRQAIRATGTYRIMCLGESTTEGGILESSYPEELEMILNKRDMGVKFGVINMGRRIIDTNYIVSNLEANLNKFKPDMVITMIGCNDSGVAYYKDIADSDTFLFKNFRAYTFLRTLWMHLVNKINRKRIDKVEGENRGSTIEFVNGYKLNSKNKETSRFEEALYKAIENMSAEYKKYMVEGFSSIKLENYSQAEGSFRKALALNPKTDWGYIGLGISYRNQARYAQAETLLKKAIKLHLKSEWAYSELAWCYKDQGKYRQAKEMFDEARKLNSKEDSYVFELALLYYDAGDYLMAKQMLKEIIALNKTYWLAYNELVNIHKYDKDYKFVEKVLKDGIENSPDNNFLYIELAWYYMFQNKFIQAEEVIKKAIALNPKNDRTYGALAILYGFTKNKSADEYHRKADALRLEYSSSLTLHNYQKIKQILDKRGIKLVCLQYPMRSVESLKKIFEGDSGVLFVDNEKTFKEAVTKDGFQNYFLDMFAGDFGHCTRKGNRLIAENAANVIAKEYFKK